MKSTCIPSCCAEYLYIFILIVTYEILTLSTQQFTTVVQSDIWKLSLASCWNPFWPHGIERASARERGDSKVIYFLCIVLHCLTSFLASFLLRKNSFVLPTEEILPEIGSRDIFPSSHRSASLMKSLQEATLVLQITFTFYLFCILSFLIHCSTWWGGVGFESLWEKITQISNLSPKQK